MKYVLILNNNVIYGPVFYDIAMIKYSLQVEEIDITTLDIPLTDPGVSVVIAENISLLQVEEVYPNTMNNKIEQLAGPFWTLTADKAICEYIVAPKNINTVRNELKQKAKLNRKKAETANIPLTINGIDVLVEGDKDNINSIAIMYPLISDTGTFKWKFPLNNIFLDITKNDLTQLLGLAKVQTQNAFDTEAETFTAIDVATTLEELDAIVIGNSDGLPSDNI